MAEKKVVDKKIAIGLGIFCLGLLAVLVGVIENYTATISTKDNQIQTLTNQKNQLQTWLDANITDYESRIIDLQNQMNSLNATYWDYVATHSHHSDSEYVMLESAYKSLDKEVSDLRAIVKLEKSTTIVSNQTVNQGAQEETVISTGHCDYAGYMQISCTTTTSTGYVKMVVTCDYGRYTWLEEVGTGKTFVAPVLPGRVEIYFGNTDPSTGASATFTITYFY